MEEYNHVFVSCDAANKIWEKVIKWLNLHFHLFSNNGEIFAWEASSSLGINKKKSLETIVLTIIWMIWQYRNNVVLQTLSMKRSNIFESILILSFDRLTNRLRLSRSNITWTLWLQNPMIHDSL